MSEITAMGGGIEPGVRERRWKNAPDEVQPAKTLWGWLQLLIVPTILIGITLAWSATKRKAITSARIGGSNRC